MRLRLVIGILLGCGLLTGIPGTVAQQDETAVTARFAVANARPYTGETFDLTLTITLPPGAELAEAPTFPAQWGEFEVVSVGELTTTTQADGSTTRQQVVQVRLWQPRDYNTPEAFIGYRLPGLTEIQRIPVRPAGVTVPTVLDFEDLTLRPFKPLIDLPYQSPWVVLAGVIAVSAPVSYLIYRWRNRPRPTIVADPVPQTPGEIALQTLAALKATPALAPADRYRATADVLRGYLLGRYGIPVQTTPETLAAARDRLSETTLTDLQRMLTEADLVKFAGAQPGDEVARRLLDRAHRWITTQETGSIAEDTHVEAAH